MHIPLCWKSYVGDQMFSNLHMHEFKSSQRNDQIKLTQFDEIKKRAHDSQKVRAKENLKLSYSRPSQRHISGTNLQIKLYIRAVIESEA